MVYGYIDVCVLNRVEIYVLNLALKKKMTMMTLHLIEVSSHVTNISKQSIGFS